MNKSKRDIYFHNLLGIKWHMQTGRKAIFKTRNGESGNGNGERGTGNL